MKALTTLCCIIAISCGTLAAQVTTPALSPFSKVEQKVGLTDVTIEYSRPSARGRTVFGDLVPYDKEWRAGANAVTKITFSTDVNVGGKDLKSGSYALLITPGKESWTLHFFAYDKSGWSSYVEENAVSAAAVVTAQTMALPFSVETWSIGVGQLSSSGASLDFIWENVYAGTPIEVPTDAAVVASIEKTMSGPSAGDYTSAASYYLNEGKDLNKALQWINMGLEKGGERYWTLRTKALIQAGLGDHAGAIETAKKSTQLAKEAGNEEYVKMNTASISEWMR